MIFLPQQDVEMVTKSRESQCIQNRESTVIYNEIFDINQYSVLVCQIRWVGVGMEYLVVWKSVKYSLLGSFEVLHKPKQQILVYNIVTFNCIALSEGEGVTRQSSIVQCHCVRD